MIAPVILQALPSIKIVIAVVRAGVEFLGETGMTTDEWASAASAVVIATCAIEVALKVPGPVARFMPTIRQKVKSIALVVYPPPPPPLPPPGMSQLQADLFRLAIKHWTDQRH